MVAYRNACVIEGGGIDWGEGVTSERDNLPLGKSHCDNFISRMSDELKADKAVVCLSSVPVFRHKVLPEYKANRKDKVPPRHLRALKNHLVESWGAILEPDLEADDLMGILATDPSFEGERIIVSIDKDMRQIPGLFYNPFPHGRDPELERISNETADETFMRQTLTGDTIDNYKGCPGIGPVKAKGILEGVEEGLRGKARLAALWQAVVQAFVGKGLTEADALVQARVARICRHCDWTKEQGVKLWVPPMI